MDLCDISKMEKEKKASKWQRTRHANLRRHRKTGTYYLHVKISGRSINRSLQTTSEEIAISRRDKEIAAEKTRARKQVRQKASIREDFFQLMTETLEARADRSSQNPKTTKYNKECMTIIRRFWPSQLTANIKDITAKDLSSIQRKLAVNYSATRQNGCLSLIVWTFKAAIDQGICAHNPTDHLQRQSVKAKPFFLPTDEQFKQIIVHMKARPCGSSTWRLVMFLAFTGCRISEAQHVKVADVDWNAELIHITARLKNGDDRWIPILPEYATELRALTSNRKATDRLLPCKDARVALTAACQDIGIPILTHHSFRKFFATKCLEAGIDFFTVAAWTGHKNLQTLKDFYHRLRMEHSKKEAQKVSFGLHDNEKIIPMVVKKGGNG